MLRAWTKLLPYFVVEKLAKKKCETFTINTMSSGWNEAGKREIVRPFKGVYISINKG